MPSSRRLTHLEEVSMDGQRFDSVARAMARGASRRGLLRGLARGAAASVLATISGHAAGAQQLTFLGPGDPCYYDSQCRGADAPLICADNGFGIDGTRNCCTFEGSRCGFDAACCSTLLCLGGVCTSFRTDSADARITDQGVNQTGYGFGPGEACVSDDQCDNSYPELGILYCTDNGYIYGAYGGEQHCCRYEGGSCGGPLSDDHSLCCGQLLCLGGVCGWK
jgi:hypothetical protein